MASISTVEEVELSLESVLQSALAGIPTLQGYKPVVGVFEDGKKKHRSSLLSQWNADLGEIAVTFQKEFPRESPVSQTVSPNPKAKQDPAAKVDIPQAHRDVLAVLEETENAPGRQFVALKWFRDTVLPSKKLTWDDSEETRQEIITLAIEAGTILTGRVPNPKSPQFPVTTIRLNRSSASQVSQALPLPRFRPVRITGEEISKTIIRERRSR